MKVIVTCSQRRGETSVRSHDITEVLDKYNSKCVWMDNEGGISVVNQTMFLECPNDCLLNFLISDLYDVLGGSLESWSVLIKDFDPSNMGRERR